MRLNRRTEVMARLRDIKTSPKVASVHASAHDQFDHDRHLNCRAIDKEDRSASSPPGVRPAVACRVVMARFSRIDARKVDRPSSRRPDMTAAVIPNGASLGTTTMGSATGADREAPGLSR